MHVLEAKDFLVQQTAEQATLEHVPLSDLEKRMMYFTETDKCLEDPIALNDAFEAEYHTDEYESKISKLTRHAHSRIKKENPEAARKWKEAIQELSKGDHYILILCNEGLDLASGVSTERPPYDQLKLLLAGLWLVAIMMSVLFLEAHFGIPWIGGPKTTSSMPRWLRQMLLTLLILGVALYLVKSLGT
jgi:competence CoiA-like predicted nuclease